MKLLSSAKLSFLTRHTPGINSWHNYGTSFSLIYNDSHLAFIMNCEILTTVAML